MATRARIGIFGGTFEPVHHGHLIVAEYVFEACGLHKVLFIVAANPWQKSGERVIGDAEERFEIVSDAIADVPHFHADRREIDRGGLTYTIDTLRELRAEMPDVDFTLVLGSDAAAKIDSWKAADEIAGLVDLAVVARPGTPVPHLSPRWKVTQVPSPAVDISSTAIRERLAAGRSVRFFVPETILERVSRVWG